MKTLSEKIITVLSQKEYCISQAELATILDEDISAISNALIDIRHNNPGILGSLPGKRGGFFCAKKFPELYPLCVTWVKNWRGSMGIVPGISDLL